MPRSEYSCLISSFLYCTGLARLSTVIASNSFSSSSVAVMSKDFDGPPFISLVFLGGSASLSFRALGRVEGRFGFSTAVSFGRDGGLTGFPVPVAFEGTANSVSLKSNTASAFSSRCGATSSNCLMSAATRPLVIGEALSRASHGSDPSKTSSYNSAGEPSLPLPPNVPSDVASFTPLPGSTGPPTSRVLLAISKKRAFIQALMEKFVANPAFSRCDRCFGSLNWLTTAAAVGNFFSSTVLLTTSPAGRKKAHTSRKRYSFMISSIPDVYAYSAAFFAAFFFLLKVGSFNTFFFLRVMVGFPAPSRHFVMAVSRGARKMGFANILSEGAQSSPCCPVFLSSTTTHSSCATSPPLLLNVKRLR
mmetsp:Transcript_52601/g.132280  ORF Transcript_52601/g.132280 Transcript_52601/m.132280 type:complete len:362 (+) Transcript_52601:379-1464(+)